MPTIADTTLHRLIRLLPPPSLRAAVWPGSGGPGAPRCTLTAGEAELRVRVEFVSVAGARLLAATAGLVSLSSRTPSGEAPPLQLWVEHDRLEHPLCVPCVLVGATPRGSDHAISVRFQPDDAAGDALHAALQIAFDQRSSVRQPLGDEVVPVVVHETWRGRTLRGVVQDRSAHGLAVMLDLWAVSAPVLGEPVRLDLRLPGQAGARSVLGEVRRVRQRPVAAAGHDGLVELGVALSESLGPPQREHTAPAASLH